MTTIPVRSAALVSDLDESAWTRAVGLVERLEGGLKTVLERWSIPTLRVALGAVFLAFGVLKFFPGVSPIEVLVGRTWSALTFGIVSGYPAMVLTATMESVVGILLVVGVFQRFALALLGVTFIGILSPLVFFTGDLFLPAPTLTAQYILKDVVLVSAALVVASRALHRAPARR